MFSSFKLWFSIHIFQSTISIVPCNVFLLNNKCINHCDEESIYDSDFSFYTWVPDKYDFTKAVFSCPALFKCFFTLKTEQRIMWALLELQQTELYTCTEKWFLSACWANACRWNTIECHHDTENRNQDEQLEYHHDMAFFLFLLIVSGLAWTWLQTQWH